MINGDIRFRVYNKCLYDIGVVLLNGTSFNIKPGSFQILSVNDILYIETNFNGKFFSKKMLVAVGEDGKEVEMQEFGFVSDNVEEHKDDIEINEMLKASAKKLEAWLFTIEDKAELHAIYEAAKKMDLPVSKIKILNEKIKNKDWLDEFEQ